MPISDEEWLAQINAESGGDQSAVSPKGAVGVAQVMKSTGPEAAALAGLPWDENRWRTDARYNAAIGRAYMNKQIEDFGGDMDMARAAYNWGPPRVRRLVQAKGRDWKRFLPDETKDYVAKLGGTMPTSKKLVTLDEYMPVPEGRTEPAYPTQKQRLSLDDYMPPSEAGGEPSTAPSTTSAQAPTIPTQRTDMGEPRTTAQKAGRAVLSAVGGLAGGMGGALVGGPLGGIAGAGLGSAAGSYAAETFDPTEHPAREALIEGAFGAAGQGVAGVFGKLIPTSIRPGGKELLALLGKRLPSPGQYFDNATLTMLHNVGMSAFLGNKSLEEATQAAVQGSRGAAKNWATQLQANLKLGGDTIGQVADAANRLNASADIRQIRAAAAAIPSSVPADSQVRNVARILTETQGNTIPFSRTMEETMANAAAQARGLPITPKGVVGLKELRTQLMDVMRDSTNTAEKQAARNLMKMVDKAAEKSLSDIDPRLATQWREGGALYTEGIQGKEIGEILSKAKVIGPREEMGKVTSSGTALLDALAEHRLAKLPTELTPAQLDNLEKMARAITAAEGSGSKAFTLVSNGLQVNAVIRTAIAAGAGIGGTAGYQTGGTPGAITGTALVLLGPAAIAKALASPATMKLLLAMSRMPASHKAAGTLGTQLISQMFREGILTADESGQPEPTAPSPQPNSGMPPSP